MGIEPTPSAWKAEVLPLNYTRLSQTTPSGQPAAGLDIILPLQVCRAPQTGLDLINPVYRLVEGEDYSCLRHSPSGPLR